MNIQKEKLGTVVVLTVSGKLDSMNAFKLHPEIESMMSEGVNKIVFDLKDLLVLDSSGIGAIVSVFKRTRANLGNTAIANLVEQPREVFTIMNMHKAIGVFNSVSDAVVALSC